MKEQLPTPQEMIAEMDLFVQGQQNAKCALARAVYFHYLNLALAESGQGKIPPQHCLVIGPTGSGKTLLLKTLGAYLDVPVLFCNVPSLTAEGYVGESIGDMLARLQSLCGGDTFKLSRAIIFLDEIDKLHYTEQNLGIRTSMVQQELLALLDGNSLVRDEKGSSTKSHAVDTSKLLVVGSGAFTGIEESAAKRLGMSKMGFLQRSSTERIKGEYAHVSSEDIINFGFLPEFVARFPSIVPLEKLSLDEYLSIFESPTQSPFSPYERLFQVHGIKLSVSLGAKARLAEQATRAEEGARGLRRAVAQVLSPIDWQLVELQSKGCTEVIITPECVERGGMPELVYGVPTDKGDAERLRRSVFVCPAPMLHRDELERSQLQFSNTAGWDKQRLRNYLDKVKWDIGWASTTDGALRWWNELEEEYAERLEVLIWFTEGLQHRRATISEAWRAWMYSYAFSVEVYLVHLDFRRIQAALLDSKALHLLDVTSASRETPEELARLRTQINYSASRSDSRFLYDCMEESLSRQQGALSEFVKRLTSYKITLDGFFCVAVLAHLYQPEGVFHYLSYLELVTSAVRSEARFRFSSDVTKNADLKYGPSESVEIETAGWFREEARRSFLERLRDAHTEVACRYEEALFRKEAVAYPLSNLELWEQLKLLRGALSLSRCQFETWVERVQLLVLDGVWGAMVTEVFEKNDEEGLRKALEELRRVTSYRPNEETWGRALVTKLKGNVVPEGEAVKYLQLIAKVIPSLDIEKSLTGPEGMAA